MADLHTVLSFIFRRDDADIISTASWIVSEVAPRSMIPAIHGGPPTCNQHAGEPAPGRRNKRWVLQPWQQNSLEILVLRKGILPNE